MLAKVRAIIRGAPILPLVAALMLVLAALFADFLAPHDPFIIDPKERYHPPFWQDRGSWEHPLGTDGFGRDVLSRVIFGARISLVVAFFAVFIAGSLGTLSGILSGFLRGWVDQVLMRLTDAWLAIPALLFALLLAALTGPGLKNIILILGFVYWTRYARVIRGEVLSLRERDFVRLATTAGCSRIRIMRKHILPNIVHTAITLASLQVGIVIVVEASLSFLGVGVPPPTPSWGLMLSEGRSGLMVGYWWLTVFPGAAIALTVLSANLLGDWLRVRLDPQLRHLL